MMRARFSHRVYRRVRFMGKRPPDPRSRQCTPADPAPPGPGTLAAVRRTDPGARLEALRRDIESLGRRFADEAPPLLSRALDPAMERLIAAPAGWFNGLQPQAGGAPPPA